jgi:predicted enzyme related to lactoylglutathione lyase
VNTFDWVEIRTVDVESTGRFYEALFGWNTVESETVAGSEVRILDTGAVPRWQNLRRVGIAQAAGKDSAGIVVYVTVANLEATLERAMRLGARVASAKTDLPGGFSASFYDPSGNILGLYEDRKPVPAGPGTEAQSI